jgi:hypothetical protein
MGTATSAAAPERARWPRVAGTPHPRLRPLVPRGYAGFTRGDHPDPVPLASAAAAA